MMRDKWLSCGTTWDHVHQRCFYLQYSSIQLADSEISILKFKIPCFKNLIENYGFNSKYSGEKG
jgi:hypothetical protein